MMNLDDCNKNKYNFKVYKNFSQDSEVLNKFQKNQINILFIDGDHKYKSVIRDFNNYKDFVKSGGFIIFDDYHAAVCPEVKKAVDYLVKNINKDEFEIIGDLKNYHNIQPRQKRPMPNINEFILYKI